MPAEFLRFQGAVPNRHGRFPGLFALANGLQADGRLSEAEERWWRANNDLGHRLYPDPSTAHPEVYDRTKHPDARAWFKAEATELLAYARGYTRLLDAHGVPWTLLSTASPGRIIYEDDVQVVATPFRHADDWPLAPAPEGWVTDPVTLRPRIVDLRALREHLSGDPLAKAIELLWSGRPSRAIEELAGHPVTVRRRALHADALRDLGEHAEALRTYDALLREQAGSPLEATLLQHRGKVSFAARRYDDAAADFARAAALRATGDPALLASSRQALEAALERAGRVTGTASGAGANPDD